MAFYSDTISPYINDFSSTVLFPVLSYIDYIISIYVTTTRQIATYILSPFLALLDHKISSRPDSLTIREAFVRSLLYHYIYYAPTELIERYTPANVRVLANKAAFFVTAFTSTVPCLYVSEQNCRGYWYGKQGVKTITKDTKVVMYIHGGGFTMGTARQSSSVFSYMIERAAKSATPMDLRVFSVEYGLMQPKLGKLPNNSYATEHCVADCLSAYDYLTKHLKIDSKNIVLAGESAGGNLSAVLSIIIRDTQRPQPAGAALISPWVDIDTRSWPHDSECRDFLTSRRAHKIHWWFDKCYPGMHKHHHQSPIHDPKELLGIAPVYVWYASNEVLYQGIHRFVEKAEKAGVLSRVICDPRLFHASPIMAFALGGESFRQLNDIIDWIQQQLQGNDTTKASSPSDIGSGTGNEEVKPAASSDAATLLSVPA